MPNNYTESAFDGIHLMTNTLVTEGNRPYQNAGSLLAALREQKMITPGKFVCRAVVQHRPELLSSNDRLCYLLEKDVEDWTATERRDVAEVLTKTFGPIHESGNISWTGILNRKLSTGRTGSHSEFFKTALCLDLSEQEVILLFLLNGQSPTIHDVLDITWFAMRKRHPDNLRWSQIMDVLRRYRHEVKEKEKAAQHALGTPAFAAQQVRGSSTSNASNLLTKLQQSTLPYDKFRDIMVEELVKNSSDFIPFQLNEELERYQPSADLLEGFVKSLAAQRSYSKTAAKTLCSVLLVLRALYCNFEKSKFDYTTWEEAVQDLLPGTEGVSQNTDKPGHERLAKICSMMFEAIGVSREADPSEDALPAVLADLLERFRGMEADARDALSVLKDQTAQKDFTHTDILVLAYFLVLGMTGLDEDALYELEKRLAGLPEETPFTRTFGEIIHTVTYVLCDELAEPNERLDAVKQIYQDMLDAFADSGLYRIAPVYFPYAPDMLLTVALLCAPSQLDNFALEDFMEDLLHPDALEADRAAFANEPNNL